MKNQTENPKNSLKAKDNKDSYKISPRELAYQLIYQVKHQGAYSNIRLNQLFRKYPISQRERGFVTELGYGTLEKVFYLDKVIAKYSKQPLHRLSPELLVLLEMGTYQLKYMDSVTDYAAVDETVQLSKKVFPQGSGYVNGILRSILRDPEAFQIGGAGNSKDWSALYGVSEDIAQSFQKDYGEQQAQLILKAMNTLSPLHLRTNSLRISREQLIQIFKDQGIYAEEHVGSLQAIQARGIKSMEDRAEFTKGLFSVQNICSILAVETLDPKEDEHILDLCACPGGKTSYIAEILKNTGQVEAWDISDKKLPLIESTYHRLGLTNVSVRCWDACIIDGENVGVFDRVLADVPCSGLGVLGRRPEIRFKTKKDWKALPPIQSRILENAGKYVKTNGVLVYSTCTLRQEENQHVVEKFLKKHSNFVPEEFENYAGKSNHGMMEILPDEHGADGFFMAKMRKKD